MPKARAALGASLSAANVSANVVCVPHLRHSEMDLPSSPLTTLKALQAHFGQIALMGFSPQHIRLEFSKDCRLSSLSARRVNKWLPRLSRLSTRRAVIQAAGSGSPRYISHRASSGQPSSPLL